MATLDNSQSNKIITGSSNDDSIINRAASVTVDAQGGADSIMNWTELGHSSLSGGAGDDFIDNRGKYVTIDGGEDNDSITNWQTDNGTPDYTSISGGAGDDSIDNRGLHVTISGGEGNDSIINWQTEHGTPDYSSISGDAGDDNIDNRGANSTILGGAGNNYVNNIASTVSIHGGEDNDTINNLSANVTIDGGDDNDKLLNIGEKVSLNGGAGHDEILVFNGSNSVTIDAGIGNDTINLESAVENILVQYTDGDGNDLIEGFNATSTLSISGGVYSTQTSGDDIIVTVGEGKITLVGAASLDAINIDGEYNPLFITLTEDDDSYSNTLDNASILALGGNDSILNSLGANVSIDGGAGNDTIRNEARIEWNSSTSSYETLESPDKATLLGGAGDDYIGNYGDSVTIDGGEGKNNISLSSYAINNLIVYEVDGGNGIIYGFNEDDTLLIPDSTWTTAISGSDIIVTVGDGNITLVGVADLETVNIVSSSSDIQPVNFIRNTLFNKLISGTSYVDSIYNSGNYVTINGNEDSDYIDNSSSYVTINAGDGNDYIYSWGSNVSIDEGAGNDFIRNRDDSVKVNGGTGDDYIYNDDADNVTIDGGEGNDLISLSSYFYFSKNNLIQYKSGNGNDTVFNFNSDDTLQIGGGTGTYSTQTSGSDIIVTVGEGQITLVGSANLSTVNILGEYKNPLLITLTEDDDTYNNTTEGATILALGGNDTLLNDAVNTTIYADSGDDSIGNHGGHQNANDLIDAGSGNDTIDNHVHDVTLKGGAGNDYIYTGDRATIYGDEGNDTIVSETFNGDSVTISGGAGNDSVSLNSNGGNILIQYTSGDGFDTIEGFKATDTLSISGDVYSTQTSGNNIIVTVGEGKITLVGAASLEAVNILGEYKNPLLITLTEDDDTYSNTVANATILALGGNDSIYNSVASVSINGGDGNDSITNRGSNVSISGDAGDDYIRNESSYVSIDGGSVSIDASDGNDTIDTNGGKNLTISGGKGNDSIYLRATGGLVQYASGDGNDTIIGFNESDTLTITGDSYSTEIDGEDVIVRVGEGSIRLVGANGKELNIRACSHY